MENLVEPSLQEGPVRQSRQRIVFGQIADALIGNAPVYGNAGQPRCSSEKLPEIKVFRSVNIGHQA